MSACWVVLRKELLDAFRDRRMVIVALVVMPLAVPLILAGMSALGMKRQVEKLEGTLELPVIGIEHAPNLVAWLGANDVDVVPGPPDPHDAVRHQEREVILRIESSISLSEDPSIHFRYVPDTRREISVEVTDSDEKTFSARGFPGIQ